MFGNYAKRTLRNLLVITSLILASSNLVADETTAASTALDAAKTKQIAAIYRYSGVQSHLSWVLSTVKKEATAAQANCSDQASVPELEAPLAELLSVEALRTSFYTELNERLSQKQRDEVMAWIKSAAGKKIHKVEASSINFNETQFEKMFSAFRDSEKNTPERNTRMRNMLADTGAVYFISAVNTETSALVAMASACSSSAEDIQSAESAVQEERKSEPLYRSFMRQELIVPSSVIYQSVSDEYVDAYTEFAKSDAGNAYFSALIKGVRSVLSGKVDSLKAALEAI